MELAVNSIKKFYERNIRQMAVAWLVLIVALAPTIYGAWRVRQSVERRDEERFGDELRGVNNLIEFYLNQRMAEIRGLAAPLLTNAVDTPELWQKVMNIVGWRQRIGGLMDIGYTEPVRDAEGHITYPILFLESRMPHPFHVLGMNLANDPGRLAAITNAIAQKYAASTGLVSMQVAGEPNPVMGTVTFMPLTEPPAQELTTEEETAAPKRLLIFSLDQQRRFASMQLSLTNRSVEVELLPPAPPEFASNRFERIITKSTLSGTWKFRVKADASFYQNAKSELPRLVLGGGVTMSLLLFGLAWAQGRRRLEAEQANVELQRRDAEISLLNADLERRIATRTGELSEANEKLKAEVAERKEAQAHLNRFKSVMDATSDLVALTTLDGRVIYANKAGRTMVGLPDDAPIAGQDFQKFYPLWVQKHLAQDALPAALRDGSWRGEVTLLHQDGHEIPVSLVALVIRNPAGEPEYMAAIHRDITERRHFEESLQKALGQEKELNQLKGNFISMVSHEIRTPLALILGSSEILSRYLERLPGEKRQRQLDNINQSVKRMSALMEDMLLFSQAEAGRMEFRPAPLDLGAFCRQLVDEAESATNRRCPIAMTLAETDALARVDESLLRHILNNLLTNAVKYSSPSATVYLEVLLEGDEVVFRVKDHGIGIPEADRKRLFTPFYRSKNVAHTPGTGLGLVIVKRCVERHSGRLEMESQPGVGTTVTIRLPKYSIGDTEFVNKPA